MTKEKGVRVLEPERFSTGTPIEHQCKEGVPRRPRLWNPLGLPAPLTWVQCFYIWAVQVSHSNLDPSDDDRTYENVPLRMTQLPR